MPFKNVEFGESLEQLMMAQPHRQKLVLMSEIKKGPEDVDHQ